MRPRIFITQPVAGSAIERLRRVATVKVNPDSSRIIAKQALIAAVRRCDILFLLLHDQIDRRSGSLSRRSTTAACPAS